MSENVTGVGTGNTGQTPSLRPGWEHVVNNDYPIPFDFTKGNEEGTVITGVELEKSNSDGFQDYEVKKGDSIWKIAKEVLMRENEGVKPKNNEVVRRMHEIMRDNNLRFADDGTTVIIRPGDKLKIKTPDAAVTEQVDIPEPPAQNEEVPEKVDIPEPPTQNEEVPEQVDIPEPPAQNEENTTKGLTPADANNARILGDNVSDYLVGYTSDAEQGHVRRIIQEDVTADNVADFLSGYENHKGLIGNHFFEQLRTEFGFKDKQNLMRNVAEKLSQNLTKHGQTGWAREVNIILENQNFNREHARTLDKIVQEYLVTIPELKVE